MRHNSTLPAKNAQIHIGKPKEISEELSYSAGIDIEERISKRLADKLDQEQSVLEARACFVERWLNGVSVVSTVLAIGIAVLSVFATFWGRDIIQSARKDMDETIDTIKKLEREAEKFRQEAETEVNKSRDLSNQVILLRKDVQAEVDKVTNLCIQVESLKRNANNEVQSMRSLTTSACAEQTNLLAIKSSVVEIRDQATTKLNQIDEYVSTTRNKVDSLFARQINESSKGFDDIISKSDVVVSLTNDEVDRLSSFLSSPYGSLGDKLRAAILIDLHKKNFEEALYVSETLYNLEPHNIPSLNAYLRLLDYCGKYAQAETVCQQIMRHPTFKSTFCSNNLVMVQNNLGCALLGQERYKEAELVFTNAISLCESQLGLSHEQTLLCRLNHFLCLWHQGAYGLAEELAKQTLAGFEKTLGTNSESTLLCQLDLAWIVVNNQNRIDEAIKIVSNVEQRVASNFGERSPLSLRTKASKAFMLFLANPVKPSQLTEATNILSAVSTQCEDVFGADNRLTLSCKIILRMTDYLLSKDNPRISAIAINDMQGIMTVIKRCYGENDPMYIKFLGVLLNSHRMLKRFADAEDTAREILRVKEHMYGIDDERTVQAMKDLSSIIIDECVYKQDVSKCHDAEIMCRNVLERQKRLLGKRTDDQTESNFLIAQLLWFQKRYNDADSLFKSTLTEAEQTMGASPTRALNIRVTYMERLASVNRFDDVIRLGEEGLSRHSTVTNTDLNVIKANHLVGVALHCQDKYNQADMFLRNAYNGYVSSKGAGCYETLKCGNALCYNLFLSGKGKNAQAFMENLITNCSPALGADSREIIQDQCLLAFLYGANNELSRAEALARETAERSKRVFSSEDVDTVECLYVLADILADNGKKFESKQCLAGIPKNIKRRSNGLCMVRGLSFFGLGGVYFGKKSDIMLWP